MQQAGCLCQLCEAHNTQVLITTRWGVLLNLSSPSISVCCDKDEDSEWNCAVILPCCVSVQPWRVWPFNLRRQRSWPGSPPAGQQLVASACEATILSHMAQDFRVARLVNAPQYILRRYVVPFLSWSLIHEDLRWRVWSLTFWLHNIWTQICS